MLARANMKFAFDAPRGVVPKRGEAWLPVGRKAAVAGFYLAPVEAVRPLVPSDLSIVEVLPGRTVASFFLGDYGPGSSLEFSEFGIQPALVRCHTGLAFWSSLVLVDSEASYVGGEALGFAKEMVEFDWEEAGTGSRRAGTCRIRQNGEHLLTVTYGQGRLPLPNIRSRVATLKDDVLFSSLHQLRGRYRLSRVRCEVPDGSRIPLLGSLGKPLAGVVVSELRGRMGDQVLATFLPERNPDRPATKPPQEAPPPAGSKEPEAPRTSSSNGARARYS